MPRGGDGAVCTGSVLLALSPRPFPGSVATVRCLWSIDFGRRVVQVARSSSRAAFHRAKVSSNAVLLVLKDGRAVFRCRMDKPGVSPNAAVATPVV